MSTTKIRKGLSYVIGESADNENHILPINTMQYSSSRGQLFTGGRDGIIKVWNKSSSGDSYLHQEDYDTDYTRDTNEQLLRLETSISSNPIPYHDKVDNFTILTHFNWHFDWINDLQLINNDNSLVTCSSDLSLKLVDLNSVSTEVHKFANVHTDYVKKVSSFNGSLVSGGLDGKVVLWDLNYLTPVRIMSNNTGGSVSSSIYSLANDNSNLIACGGPSNTINIFDRRLELPFIKKLIGHQDNVRSLLMNDNFILSGSSDSTIKLWDIRNYKVFKNFNIHDDPVWCLTSSSPDFKTFFSADKKGNVIKTDLSYISDSNSSINDRLGLSTLVAKAELPVMALCAETDSNDDEVSLFASTDMSLNRFYIPNTKQLAHYQYLRNVQDYESQIVGDDPSMDQNKDSDLNSDFYDLVSHLSMDTNLDIQSSFSNNVGQQTPDEVDTSLYDSMFININGGPSMEFVNVDKTNKLKPHELINNTPVEILLNPVNAEQITLQPFNRKPFHKIHLTPKSIIAKRLFNDKRTMLVLYLNGDITIWDIFICKKIKTFKYNQPAEMTSEIYKNRIKDMDSIFQEYQTVDTLNNWCEVEIKSGKLLVTLTETSFNNVEIYYDELIKSYPFLSIDHNEDAKKNSKVNITDDDRLQLSKILLNSIFANYSMYEYEFDRDLREDLRASRKPEPKESSTFNRIKMFSRKSSSNNIQQLNGGSKANSTSNSTTASLSEVSINNEQSLVHEFFSSVPEDLKDDSINSIILENRRFYLERLHTLKKTPETALKVYSNNSELTKIQAPNDDSILFKPLIDLKQLPPDLLIIIFENSPSLGNLRDVFSFRLNELKDLKYDPKFHNNFIKELRTYLPKWIGYPILLDKFPLKESPKIAFQLLELDYNVLPPEKKIGGKSQRKIKRLPVLESSIKLTSHNMLRVSKIINYLTDKFESRTSEMKDKIPPTEWLVLECKGVELDNRMTLQTIKSKIWKSSSDIELRFRRKFDV